jgi:anti-sigma regulatory factor (Ser/Thr protein kinase)
VSESQSATFPASPASARAARSFLRDALPGEAEADLTDVILLLVTELVTNAVIHARTSVHIQVALRGEVVRVDVQDEAPEPPVRQPASPEALNGRGLLLLDKLADRWGFEPRPSGKTVWFEVSGIAPGPDRHYAGGAGPSVP